MFFFECVGLVYSVVGVGYMKGESVKEGGERCLVFK